MYAIGKGVCMYVPVFLENWVSMAADRDRYLWCADVQVITRYLVNAAGQSTMPVQKSGFKRAICGRLNLDITCFAELEYIFRLHRPNKFFFDAKQFESARNTYTPARATMVYIRR